MEKQKRKLIRLEMCKRLDVCEDCTTKKACDTCPIMVELGQLREELEPTPPKVERVRRPYVRKGRHIALNMSRTRENLEKLKDERIALIHERAKEGKYLRHIADELGVTPSSIAQYIHNHMDIGYAELRRRYAKDEI